MDHPGYKIIWACFGPPRAVAACAYSSHVEFLNRHGIMTRCFNLPNVDVLNTATLEDTDLDLNPNFPSAQERALGVTSAFM